MTEHARLFHFMAPTSEARRKEKISTNIILDILVLIDTI